MLFFYGWLKTVYNFLQFHRLADIIAGYFQVIGTCRQLGKRK